MVSSQGNAPAAGNPPRIMHEQKNRQTLTLAWIALALLPVLYLVFGLVDLARDGLKHADRPALTIAAISAVFLVCLSLLSMGRVWTDAFWAPPSNLKETGTPGAPLLIAIAALGLVTVAISVGAEPLFEVTARAARQLLDRNIYITAVLGGTS